MQAPDGTLIPNRGVYLEVVMNERLVFTDALAGAGNFQRDEFLAGDNDFYGGLSWDAARADIVRRLHVVLGDLPVELLDRDTIAPEKSGKYRWVISEAT